MSKPKTPRAAQAPRASETQECIAFVDWSKLVRFDGEPLFERLVHIANERGRAGVHVAIAIKAGMKKGFPDYQLLVSGERYRGLLIEAKRQGKGGGATTEQLDWQRKLRRWGYACELAVGTLDLIAIVRAYMAALEMGDRWDDRTDVRTPVWKLAEVTQQPGQPVVIGEMLQLFPSAEAALQDAIGIHGWSKGEAPIICAASTPAERRAFCDAQGYETVSQGRREYSPTTAAFDLFARDFGRWVENYRRRARR